MKKNSQLIQIVHFRKYWPEKRQPGLNLSPGAQYCFLLFFDHGVLQQHHSSWVFGFSLVSSFLGIKRIEGPKKIIPQNPLDLNLSLLERKLKPENVQS